MDTMSSGSRQDAQPPSTLSASTTVLAKANILIASLFVAAILLQVVQIVRTELPAQDGLRFIATAQQFHRLPWLEVLRNHEDHPVYPALIALIQPLVAGGQQTDALDVWRLSAQVVSLLAWLASVAVFVRLIDQVFNRLTAACGLALILTVPQLVDSGHDTLADALGLLSMSVTLGFGLTLFRTRSPGSALGVGLSAGLGYLARPEAILAGLAVGIAWAIRVVPKSLRHPESEIDVTARRAGPPREAVGLIAMAVSCLACVGLYTTLKGHVSEKLAIRYALGLPPVETIVRDEPLWLPTGLDDPRWDFSAKEESEAPPPAPWPLAIARVIGTWVEVHGVAIAALSAIGWLGLRMRPESIGSSRLLNSEAINDFRLLAGCFAGLFAVALIGHTHRLGYLSDRHLLGLTLVTLPGAAWAIREQAPRWLRTPSRWRRWIRIACLGGLLIGPALAHYGEPPHAGRWGHGEAGRWLAEHRKPGESVLDTRGWASRLAGGRAYDYWHVRQALSDSSLTYIVVTRKELEAGTPRARTLASWLDYASRPLVSFPNRRGETTQDVWIYRFERPDDWGGILR